MKSLIKLHNITRSTLFKDTLIYGLTNALYSGLPLLLMPFLVTVLSPEDYGITDLFRSISLVLTPILGLSTIQSIGRYFYDLEENDFKKFVSSIIIFHFIMAVIGVSIITGFSFLVDDKYKILAYLSIFYFVFNQTTEALLVIYRVKRKSKKYLIIRISSVVVDLLLLTILYFVLTNYTWLYRVLPNVISIVIFGVISVFLLLRDGYKPILDISLLRESIKYSSPLILHMISGYILNVGDRFLILHFLDETQLGNYAVAYQLGMAINFFYTSFNLAWTPTFYEWMKQNKRKAINKVRILVYVLLLGIGMVSVLIWLLGIQYLENFSRYDISLNIVLLIVSSYIILSFYKFEANYFLYSKKTKALSIITFSSAVATIILNIILLPRVGIIGAAITTLVSCSIMYILVLTKTINEKENIES